MTEKEIINKCIRGNRKAQKKLYDQYSKQMYSICLRYCKRKDLAADALQNAFLKVFKKIHTFKSEGNIGGWIRRIVINAALDLIRLEKHHFENIEDVTFASGLQTEIEVNIESYDWERMMSFVQDLPEGYRVVFSMYVLDELSHAEIAAILNISINTSRSQLLKARRILQSLFVKDHYLSSEYNLN